MNKIQTTHGGTVAPRIGDICNAHYINGAVSETSPVTIYKIEDGTICIDESGEDWITPESLTLIHRPYNVGDLADYHRLGKRWIRIIIDQTDLDGMVRGDKEWGCRPVRDYYRHAEPLWRDASCYKHKTDNIGYKMIELSEKLMKLGEKK